MTSPTPTAEPPRLDLSDVSHLLRIMGELAAQRNDPRRWRLTMLGEINRLLPASASAAFILGDLSPGIPPMMVSLFDAGFKAESQRHAFHQEFNVAPFSDPLSRAALEKFLRSGRPSMTVLRRDLVADDAWYAAAEVRLYRQEAQVDDCIFSIYKGAETTQAFVLCAFRAWDASTHFGARERALVETLHTGLEWMYRTEEANGRLSRATELPPRVRETLDYLLSGLTERQVARRMTLSVHTVHDYVKMLYAHFGVSSRSELLTRWLRAGGTLPERRPSDAGPSN